MVRTSEAVKHRGEFMFMFQVIGGDDDRGLLGPLRDIPIASLEVWKRRKGKNLEANSNNPTAANQRRGKKDTYTTDDALFFVMELNNAAKSGGPNLTITSWPCRSINITRKSGSAHDQLFIIVILHNTKLGFQMAKKSSAG